MTIKADGFSESGRKRISIPNVPEGTPCEVATHAAITWGDIVIDLDRPLIASAPSHLDARRHVCIGNADVKTNLIVITRREIGLDWSDVADPPKVTLATWDASHPAPQVEDRLAEAPQVAAAEEDGEPGGLAIGRIALAVAAVGLLTLLLIRMRRAR